MRHNRKLACRLQDHKLSHSQFWPGSEDLHFVYPKVAHPSAQVTSQDPDKIWRVLPAPLNVTIIGPDLNRARPCVGIPHSSPTQQAWNSEFNHRLENVVGILADITSLLHSPNPSCVLQRVQRFFHHAPRNEPRHVIRGKAVAAKTASQDGVSFLSVRRHRLRHGYLFGNLSI